MDNKKLAETFSHLSTPLIADASLRVGLPLRIAPAGNRPIIAGQQLAGHAHLVRHYGSVDIFLEAISDSKPNDTLVIDNSGRIDEGPIVDLTVLETQAGGLAGIVIWATHRDTTELNSIGFPVFSYGAYPTRSVRLDRRKADELISAALDRSRLRARTWASQTTTE